MISEADIAKAAPFVAKVQAAGGQYQQNQWVVKGVTNYLVRFLVPGKSAPGAESGVYSQGEGTDFTTALQNAAIGLPATLR